MQTLELEKNPTFGIQDGAIEILRDEYMPLAIRDVNDKEGYDAVHAARMDVKKRRVAVEHKRKELNSDAQDYIRAVNSEAKRITGLLEPIETHLIDQEGAYKAEKARLAREAEERREAALRRRLDALTECGCMMNPRDVEAMSDDDFANVLEIKRTEYEARQREEEAKREREQRIRERYERAQQRYETLRELDCLVAIEKLSAMSQEEFDYTIAEALYEKQQREEAKAAEEKRLAAERAALESQRKEQAKREAELLAERERLAREEADRQRAVELEQAQREAEERTRREAEERRQREERERIEREKSEAEARRLAEEAKPDQDRIRSVANLVAAIVVPSLSERNQLAGHRVRRVLHKAEANIRTIASEIGIVIP